MFLIIKLLISMSDSTQFNQPVQKYFSVDSARKYAKDFADFELSKASFYRLSHEGKLPCIKGPGGRLLINVIQFRAWLEGGEVSVEVSK